jgi:hypothetical protein
MTQTSPGGTADKVERAGEEADRSDWMDHAVRIGLVAYGFVHLMIAWVAIQLALGKSNGNPSAKGALAHLADEPFGHVLLWAVAMGLFLLVVWRILEAIGGHRDEDGAKRVWKRLFSVGRAVIYGAIGFSAARVATGSGGGSSSKQSKTMTARVLDWPAGELIVGLVGLGILAYGAMLVWRGCTDGFLEHIDGQGQSGDSGTAYTWLGRAGYVSKGIAIGIVGCLFGYAAINHDPNKTGGLDQALREVLDRPFGPTLLLVTAAGIGCYGLFCFARARHLSR